MSLVPSVTEAVAAMGAGEHLVGVTDWCAVGAPAHAARVGGTKSPSLAKIAALRPDVVVVNQEENRREDAEALGAAGIEVLVTFPRTVADVPPMLRELGALVRRASQADAFACDLEEALAEPVPDAAVPVLTLIWRKPWMAVGAGTFADDLLHLAGFRNVLTDRSTPYPKVQALSAAPDVVLLPTEPYEFGEKDLSAVRELVGERPALEFVDGQLLTWHGVRTATALRHFRAVARRLNQ
ncbi:MAG TPA: helical backbone metal receptor [Egibacteraceae bacterium]|nr:helical backbone metal receptor [Egibacteraceae bacterium]